MYDIKLITKILKVLEQYDFQYGKVSRKFNIPTTTLRMWVRKKNDGRPIILRTRHKSSKWC